MKFYILNEDKTLKKVDMLDWLKWFVTADRHVACTSLDNGITISTVFVGLDVIPIPLPSGHPYVFETAIFGGQHNGYMQKSSSLQNALETHDKAVSLAKNLTKIT